MKFFKNSYFIVVLILLITVSCVKQNTVDFSQANDITFNQQIKTGFINFKIDSSFFNGFNVNSLPIGTQNQFETHFEVFNNSEFEQHLDSVNFHFEIVNMYDRDFALVINFLDKNDNIKYTLNLNASKNTTTPIDINITRSDILKLIFTIKANIRITIINKKTNNNDPSSTPFNFKSSAILYLLY